MFAKFLYSFQGFHHLAFLRSVDLRLPWGSCPARPLMSHVGTTPRIEELYSLLRLWGGAQSRPGGQIGLDRVERPRSSPPEGRPRRSHRTLLNLFRLRDTHFPACSIAPTATILAMSAVWLRVGPFQFATYLALHMTMQNASGSEVLLQCVALFATLWPPWGVCRLSTGNAIRNVCPC